MPWFRTALPLPQLPTASLPARAFVDPSEPSKAWVHFDPLDVEGGALPGRVASRPPTADPDESDGADDTEGAGELD